MSSICIRFPAQLFCSETFCEFSLFNFALISLISFVKISNCLSALSSLSLQFLVCFRFSTFKNFLIYEFGPLVTVSIFPLKFPTVEITLSLVTSISKVIIFIFIPSITWTKSLLLSISSWVSLRPVFKFMLSAQSMIGWFLKSNDLIGQVCHLSSTNLKTLLSDDPLWTNATEKWKNLKKIKMIISKINLIESETISEKKR